MRRRATAFKTGTFYLAGNRNFLFGPDNNIDNGGPRQATIGLEQQPRKSGSIRVELSCSFVPARGPLRRLLPPNCSAEFGFDRQVVVDGLHEILPGAEVALGGLHGRVAEQQLDLLEIAAGASVQFRAGPPQVVGREARLPEPGAVLADDVPDSVLAEATVENPAAFVQRPEHWTLGDADAFEPFVDDDLDPGRQSHGPQPVSFSLEVRDDPARVPQLETVGVEGDRAPPGADHSRAKGPGRGSR